MMPVIAFGCAAVIYIYLGLQFGFRPNKRNNKTLDYNKIEKNEVEQSFDDESELSYFYFDEKD